MQNDTKAAIINTIHKVIIMYMIVGWLSTDVYQNIFYLTCLMTLKVHWYANDDTCALTIMEQKLTGVKKEESFMNQVVNPIYKISDDETKKITSFATDILLVVILFKLVFHKDLPKLFELMKNGEITKILDRQL